MTGHALERIETARLLCVRPRPEHLDDLRTLLCDPRVARTLTVTGEPASEAEVASSLAAKHRDWEQHGFGLWMLYDRVTRGFLGRGGLQRTLVTGTPEVEIGWAIVPARWGEGLATELAHASIDAGFGGLGRESLIAYTRVDNAASRRVMEKAGLTYECDLEHVGLLHALYRRTRC